MICTGDTKTAEAVSRISLSAPFFVVSPVDYFFYKRLSTTEAVNVPKATTFEKK